MDTLGGLIDKLYTADMKMWNNQEFLYDIRRMSFDDFYGEYLDTKEGQQKLYDVLHKLCDLNLQRSDLIDEIDQRIVEMIGRPELDNGRYIQRKHKTYP